MARAPVTRSRLLNGPAPVLVLVVAAAVAAALRGGFTDLDVYLYGGRRLLDGLPLYGPATRSSACGSPTRRSRRW